MQSTDGSLLQMLKDLERRSYAVEICQTGGPGILLDALVLKMGGK